MRYVIISGIDGCGKTTVIERLRERFEAKGLKIHCEWLRYSHILVKPVHGLCRLVGLSRKYKVNSECIWRHEFYRNQIFCSLYVFLTWLDTWLSRLKLDLKTTGRKIDIVICDRWVNDILIDLAVDTRREQLLYGKWYQRFIRILPKNSKQYLITRDTRDILSARPQSVQDTNFSFRHRLYKQLGNIADITVVNSNSLITTTVNAILTNWQESSLQSSTTQQQN